MGGRMMPVECEHGVVLDWGDFGPDLSDQPNPCAVCAAQALVHRYLSTACHHEHHERCRLTCKFCEERCICDCHRPLGESA